MQESRVNTREGPVVGVKTPKGPRSLRAIVLVGLLALLALCLATPALAIGPNAVRYPTGWDTNAVARGDDTSNLVVGLPFTMTWNGTSYTQAYLNMNGNITFGSGNTVYRPTALSGLGQAMMAPFWADVDSDYVGAPNRLYYSNLATGSVQVNGHNAVIFTWANVMRYNGTTQSSDTTDTFQLVLIDRSDTGAGNFDFEYNYDKMVWDTGTASTGYPARAGWATAAGTSYEMPGSGTTGAMLDGGPSASSLIQNYQNPDGQLGRYLWQIRNGAAPNQPPKVTVVNRTLEGNCSGGYIGYTGSADATATDTDGMIYDFNSNLPAKLLLGQTNVAWTAYDDDAASTTVSQSITVTDTTAPSNPALTGSIATGVWTSNNVVGINGTGVSDICSGLNGFSYLWSQNAAATPDTSSDVIATNTVTGSSTTTVTVIDTATVDYQSFPTATWPAAWTRSDATYIRLTNTAGRFYDTYAAEAWDNGGTNRVLSFYRDYNLAGYTTANLNFRNQMVALAGGTDYERVEYSTNGGTTWTQIENITAATAWTQRSYSLPVGGTVRVRFSACVNAAAKYVDWDAIAVTGYTVTNTPVVLTTSTTSLGTTPTVADGVWYFNVRSVDKSGNWSGTTSIGPFQIDTAKPVTTCSAPSTWQSGTVNASLTATDSSGGPIKATYYQINGGAVTTYTVPVAFSVDGTYTLTYWSVDMAGNTETTKTANIKIDKSAPSTPTSVTASVASTTSIQVSWNASVDSVSGIAYYSVFRDGSFLATTAAGPYMDTGLASGSTHTYYVVAYNGSNMPSSNSATSSATTPSSAIWMSLSTGVVDMGSMNPGVASTLASATTVKVGGIGSESYDFWCSGTDFSNAATSSATPTMTISALAYSTSGYVTLGQQPFSLSPYKIDTSTGTNFVWEHDYRFDYVITPPWVNDPGTYNTVVTYTVVSH